MKTGKSILIIIGLLTISSIQLSFSLGKNRPYCFFIKGGTTYEFQYMVSGQGQQNVICTIQDGAKNIAHVQYKSEYDSQFSIQSQQGRICFYNRDGLAKQVSFDFLETKDPIKNTLTQQRKQKTHQLLYHAYNQMNRVYRDQHFLLERKHVHDQMLNSAENKLLKITIVKAILIVASCAFQLFIIKKIVDGQFSLSQSKKSQK